MRRTRERGDAACDLELSGLRLLAYTKICLKGIRALVL